MHLDQRIARHRLLLQLSLKLGDLVDKVNVPPRLGDSPPLLAADHVSRGLLNHSKALFLQDAQDRRLASTGGPGQHIPFHRGSRCDGAVSSSRSNPRRADF